MPVMAASDTEYDLPSVRRLGGRDITALDLLGFHEIQVQVHDGGEHGPGMQLYRTSHGQSGSKPVNQPWLRTR